MSARARQLDVPLSLAALLLIACCGLPLLALAVELAQRGALAEVRSALGDARAWTLLSKSLGLAVVTTLAALSIGVPLGTLLGRCDVIGRRLALWLHLFPLFLPPFLIALGGFQILGRGGLLGSAWSSSLWFGPLGVVATSTLAFTPVVTALTALALQGIDPALEESARVVAPRMRVVTRILWPLCWPSIALGALIVLALSLSEIGVPMFLGVRTYSAAVFTRLAGIDYAPGEAVALVLPLLVIALALVAIDRRMIGGRAFTTLGPRSSERTPLELGPRRAAVSALVWLAITLPLAPLLALLLRAGREGLAAAGAWLGASVTTSLAAGLGAATAIVLAGGVIGHALARRQRFARGLDTLALLSFMTPSAVLGVGLIATWNHPSTRLVYGSLAILVLGLVARYAVIGVRLLSALCARSPVHHEEAAMVFGAGRLRRLGGIVAPMHARGIAGAWLIALVFALRDLDTLIVFHPPGLEPLVVRIFTLEANGPEPIVAALCVVQVALTAILLALGGLLLSPRRGVA